jgi:ABC-type glycerol-3-phosphate transport system substrate-binding protein
MLGVAAKRGFLALSVAGLTLAGAYSADSATFHAKRIGADAQRARMTAGHVTLSIVDTGTDPGTTAEYDALIKIFQRVHPNVTVKREPESFSSLISSIKSAGCHRGQPGAVGRWNIGARASDSAAR